MKNCPNPFDSKVKCHECKHWLDKIDTFKVTYILWNTEITEYYCPMHKKPYNRREETGTVMRYYGEVEMKEDGTPV